MARLFKHLVTDLQRDDARASHYALGALLVISVIYAVTLT